MTVISITDRDTWWGPTDNIVVADPSAKTLTWVPRDVWSDLVGGKINSAYRDGGHEMLIKALNAFGLPVKQSLCLMPKAIASLIGQIQITVPVERSISFWYPETRGNPIEDGRRLVAFNPPAEIISGDRIHEWVGARYSADGQHQDDITRIRRQQSLVLEILKRKEAVAWELVDKASVSIFPDSFAFPAMDASWTARIFEESKLKSGIKNDQWVFFYEP